MLLGEQNDAPSTRFIAILAMSMVMLLLLPVIAHLFAPGEPPQPPDNGRETVAVQEEPPAPPELAPAPDAEPPEREEPEAELPEEPPALSPAPPETAEETVVLENGLLRLEFTALGARLRQAHVLVGKTEDEHPQLVDRQADSSSPDTYLPLDIFGLRPDESWMGDELSRVRWEPRADALGRSVSYTFEAPGTARITKTFTLHPDDYLLDIHVNYTNLAGTAQRLGADTHIPAFSITWEPNLHAGDVGRDAMMDAIVWRTNGQTESLQVSKLKPPLSHIGYSQRMDGASWAAVRSLYFLTALRPLPREDAQWAEGLWGWVSGSPSMYRMGLAVPRAEVAPGARFDTAFRLYLGPTHLGTLKQASSHGFPELEEALQYFSWPAFAWIMNPFAKLLLNLLNFFHDHVYANYGIAIILLTIVVRVVVFPLTIKSMKSMKRMQLLQPEIEKLKEETKDDPQEFQKRTMELYKHYGVNPLGGCMPLLLQMPVFFALYRMLWMAFELRGAEFLWVTDLSQQDAFYSFREIPLVFGMSISALNLLPILMGVAMLISQRMTPTTAAVNPQQKIIMNIMPVFLSVILYNYAAGLNLYILTSTLLGIGQNFLIRAQKVELAPKEQKTKVAAKRKPQHFYNAAQAKKREMVKETRRNKKRLRGRGEDGGKR